MLLSSLLLFPSSPAAPSLTQDEIDQIATGVASQLRGTTGRLFNPRILDQDGQPVEGARLSVLRGGIVKASESTDITGHVLARGSTQAGLVLAAASDYTWRVVAADCLPTGPVALNLTQDAAPQLTLQRTSISEPPEPGLVPLDFYGLPFGLSGAGVKVTAEILLPDGSIVEQKVLLDRIKEGTTNENSFCRLWVLPSSDIGGAVYLLSASRKGTGATFKRKIRVPDIGGEVAKLPAAG